MKLTPTGRVVVGGLVAGLVAGLTLVLARPERVQRAEPVQKPRRDPVVEPQRRRLTLALWQEPREAQAGAPVESPPEWSARVVGDDLVAMKHELSLARAMTRA